MRACRKARGLANSRAVICNLQQPTFYRKNEVFHPKWSLKVDKAEGGEKWRMWNSRGGGRYVLTISNICKRLIYRLCFQCQSCPPPWLPPSWFSGWQSISSDYTLPLDRRLNNSCILRHRTRQLEEPMRSSLSLKWNKKESID